MNFKDYQAQAMTTARYDYHLYPVLALPEEVGELVGLFAKELRGDDMVERFGSLDAYKDAVVKEAGDVLWQLTAIMNDIGVDMDAVATLNLEKLAARELAGTIKGTGSDR